jgi:hypothetical protein
MAQKIRFRLDDTIYNGIANAEDFGVTISEDTVLNFRFVSFDNELTFVTDAFQYLDGLIGGTCGCGLVDVTVEYLCSSQSWQRLCTGYIILSECITDMDKCKIRTKVYDNTFSTLINNNKSIPFSVRSTLTKNLIPLSSVPDWFVMDMFVPATGSYDTTNFIYTVRVEDAIKHIVKCMTDDRVDCVAPVFASGQYENLMILNGSAIGAPQVRVETIISYESLYVALSSKLRLGMKTTLQDNGRPLLTIDYASVIDAQANTIEIPSVAGVTKKTDTTMLYASVRFGNSSFFEQWECNGGDTPCTFTQTPFRGYRDEVFGLLGDCNTSTQLNLLTNEVIFDTNIIEDIFVWGNRGYDTNGIIINCENSVIPIIKRAKRGDPYAIGQTVYNADFTNSEVAANWINGMPNSLAFYGQDFAAADVDFSYQADNTPEMFYEVIFATPTSYVGFNGDFPVVGDAVISNPNYLLGRTFRVPVTGAYTFFARLIIKKRGIDAFYQRVAFTSIMHYNSTDDLITQYNGIPEQGANTVSLFPEITVTFICNEGDLIRCNSSGYVTTDTTRTYVIPNSEIDGFGNEVFSVFRGTGVPLTETELQPFDPCDYKRNLYDFERALTMQEIQALMDNPSAPVKFSRTSNINAGASGVSSKIAIESIIRQKANFTIRSNKNL